MMTMAKTEKVGVFVAITINAASSAAMNPKITADHLGRAAVVYIRQSTMSQVVGSVCASP